MESLIIIIEEFLRRNIANVEKSQENYEKAILKTCNELEALGMPKKMSTITVKGILKSWSVEFS